MLNIVIIDEDASALMLVIGYVTCTGHEKPSPSGNKLSKYLLSMQGLRERDCIWK